MSLHHIRVGVVRGGPSSEYEVSLNTGKEVLSALRNHWTDQYNSHDIFIDRNGVWHIDGIATRPENALPRFDVIFNALHGTYGEDGKLQHFLESHGIPFTGSGSLASAVGMNKSLAKNIFKTHNILTPRWKEIPATSIRNDMDELVRKIFHTWHLPVILKPVTGGSSIGVTVVRSYAELPTALMHAVQHGNVLMEEFIEGKEATCAVIEGFRGQELYCLPTIEIRPHSGIFDYEAKYQGKSEEIVPARFPHETKQKIEELTTAVHRILGLRHYSRTDFIIHPRRGIYVLETNTLPGLTEESLLPKALRSVGSSIHEFAGHILSLAHRGSGV